MGVSAVVPFDQARLERLMAEQGVDVVLASTRHNVRYLTGGHYFHFFARTQRQGGGQYLALAAVPRNMTDSFYVGTRGDGDEAMWVGERLPPGADAAAAASGALRDRGLGSATIAVEMPFLPAAAYLTLQRELPSARLVDATRLLGELRAVKRPDELERLGRVHRVTAEAIRAAMVDGGPGRTTRELAAAVERGVAGRGAVFLYCLANVSPSMVREPGEQRWIPGSALHLDAGCEIGDYASDICRMGGPAESEARAMYEACVRVQDGLRTRLGAGMTCGEVQRLGEALMRDTPWGGASRFIAHGLGMVSHEPPDVEPGSARVLEPGMVLSLETEFRREGAGHVKFEDSVAITATGCEGLGDAAREWVTSG